MYLREKRDIREKKREGVKSRKRRFKENGKR